MKVDPARKAFPFRQWAGAQNTDPVVLAVAEVST
jgi:hypothetical protein